ncbi:MAG: FAD-binding protein [Halanaerobiales bacterium]|nr:FAD-binding protein [Halanaerobiales bacterium]
MEIRKKELLKYHTGLRIGGPASLFMIPNRIEDLRQAVVLSGRKKMPFKVIGNGSSIIVSSKGYDGIIIKLVNVLNHIRFEKNRIYVGAGATMPTLIRQALARGLNGLENWWGLASTVGGWLIRMGLSQKPYLDHLINELYVMEPDGCLTRFIEPSQIFDKGFFNQRVVVEVVFQLRPGDRDEMNLEIERRQAECDFLAQTRLPMAGPIFLTSEGDLTSLFVDKKLSGLRIGKAALLGIGNGYVTNLGDATYQDVLKLIDRVKQIVKDKDLKSRDGLCLLSEKEVIQC